MFWRISWPVPILDADLWDSTIVPAKQRIIDCLKWHLQLQKRNSTETRQKTKLSTTWKTVTERENCSRYRVKVEPWRTSIPVYWVAKGPWMTLSTKGLPKALELLCNYQTRRSSPTWEWRNSSHLKKGVQLPPNSRRKVATLNKKKER